MPKISWSCRSSATTPSEMPLGVGGLSGAAHDFYIKGYTPS